MSGHSKWSTIKRKKGLLDAQKAKEFTKIAKMITVATQNGIGDPALNPSLALAIDKARAINMPKDNIERAIKRGTGEGGASQAKLEEISYEGYAPLNVAVIIDCTTDNRNRTVGELRSLMEKHGGRFTDAGTVSWQFETKGRILLEFENSEEEKLRKNAKWNDNLGTPKLSKENSDDFILELFDQEGVQDVISDEYGVEIITDYHSLNNARKFIESKNIKISDAEIIKISQNLVKISESESEKIERFIEIIEELDDVQKVWTNWDQ